MVKNNAEVFKKHGFIFYKSLLTLGFFMIQNLYQLYSELNTSKRLLSTITSCPEKFYCKKIKPKKKFGTFQEENNSIKLRHLMPPVQSLKVIQSKICHHLEGIELPDSMYGSIKGCNNIINALQHIQNTFFFKIDLKNFFSNITNKQVHHALVENGFAWDVSRILTKLTTYHSCLPQGAPTSPILANIAFAKTARQLEEFAKDYGITFTVFIDDLVFSSKKDFKHLSTEILNIIKLNGFFPNNKKISYRKYLCEVTGLLVGNGKLKLVPKMKEAAKLNPRVKRYNNFVNECYDSYLINKLSI